jgi:universal stress protein A
MEQQFYHFNNREDIMIPLTKIFCPTDFSEPSYKALQAANDLAMHFQAELILIHVMHPIILYPAAGIVPGIMTPPSEDMYRDEMANKSLAMILNEKVSNSIKSKSILGNGNPADEIVRHAKEEKADLIVIGTHGFTGWRHMILGSVAEKVVRYATCPVLTIPAHNL